MVFVLVLVHRNLLRGNRLRKGRGRYLAVSWSTSSSYRNDRPVTLVSMNNAHFLSSDLHPVHRFELPLLSNKDLFDAVFSNDAVFSRWHQLNGSSLQDLETWRRTSSGGGELRRRQRFTIFVSGTERLCEEEHRWVVLGSSFAFESRNRITSSIALEFMISFVPSPDGGLLFVVCSAGVSISAWLPMASRVSQAASTQFLSNARSLEQLIREQLNIRAPSARNIHTSVRLLGGDTGSLQHAPWLSAPIVVPSSAPRLLVASIPFVVALVVASMLECHRVWFPAAAIF